MKNVVILDIIMIVSILLPSVFLVSNKRLFKKQVIKEYSHVYGLKLNTVKIQYSILEDRIKDFPLMDKEISRLINLEHDKYIDIGRLNVARYKVFNLKPLINGIELFVESENCNDQDILELFFETRLIIKEITQLKSPIKCKYNYKACRLQLSLVLFISKKFNQFKKYSRCDLENIDKGTDSVMDCNLDLLR